MAKIVTVTGEIEAEQLGFTSMHEHVLAYLVPFFKKQAAPEFYTSLPIAADEKITMDKLAYLNELGLRSYCADNWDLLDKELMLKEVEWFKQRGGNSILEVSAPGIRGDANGMRDISRQSGVNIIASTGLYVKVSWPEKFNTMSPKAYQAYLLDEIENGIDGTDIRAGHIKTAIRSEAEDELKFMEKSAEVAGEKNMLLTAHASRGVAVTARRKLVRRLLETGMPPEKLLLCRIHFSFWQGDFVDALLQPDSCQLQLDWAREVLDMGVNVCVDCFGEQPGVWNSIRLAGLIKLLNAGYEDQIVIGNDVYQKTMTRACGNFGYCGIIDYVIPELLRHGISKDVIDKITVKNAVKMLQCGK